MRAVRRWVHDRTRRHYLFAQGTTEFFMCVPRWRWQNRRRPTEYAVVMGELAPVRVTREQFVNLDRRLSAEGTVTLAELDDEEDRDE